MFLGRMDCCQMLDPVALRKGVSGGETRGPRPHAEKSQERWWCRHSFPLQGLATAWAWGVSVYFLSAQNPLYQTHTTKLPNKSTTPYSRSVNVSIHFVDTPYSRTCSTRAPGRVDPSTTPPTLSLMHFCCSRPPTCMRY